VAAHPDSGKSMTTKKAMKDFTRMIYLQKKENYIKIRYLAIEWLIRFFIYILHEGVYAFIRIY
jgi:hypothetical protein